MTADTMQAELFGLARAACRAGELRTFRRAVQLNLDEIDAALAETDGTLISNHRRRVALQGYAGWLTDAELVQVALRAPAGAIVDALAVRAYDSVEPLMRDIGDFEVWEFLERAGTSLGHEWATPMIGDSERVMRIARTAIREGWSGLRAARIIGCEIAQHPDARSLFDETGTHTATTLTLLAGAAVEADAQIAAAFADGQVRVVDDGCGPVDFETLSAFGAALWFARTVSDTAEIDEALCDQWLATNDEDPTPAGYNVALRADWRDGDAAVTARAGVLVDAILASNPAIDCMLEDAAAQWVARVAPTLEHTKLEALHAQLGSVATAQIGGHCDAGAARRLIELCDPHELLGVTENVDAVAALLAAHAAGIVPTVARSDTAVTGLLCAKLVAAASGTAAGYETLAGLARGWEGTVDDLAATIQILADCPNGASADDPRQHGHAEPIGVTAAT